MTATSYKRINYSYIIHIPELHDLINNAFPNILHDYGYFIGTVGITSKMYLLTYEFAPSKYIWDKGPKFLTSLGLKYDVFYRDGKAISIQLHIHKNKIQTLFNLLKLKQGV